MAERTIDVILENIRTRIADNNSGDISAADIRENMVDIADSILYNVSIADWTVDYPFKNDILLQVNTDPEQDNVERGGTLTVESGIYFKTSDAQELGLTGSELFQTVPYPGPGEISHQQLKDLEVGNPHPQYLPFSGGNMVGPIGMGGYTSGGFEQLPNWISSQGIYQANKTLGIYFENKQANIEHVHLGSGTLLEFDSDHSIMKSAVGLAHAYIRFDATQGQAEGEDITVLSSYNIQQIKRIDQGKFEIYFKSNAVFDHSNYVVVAHSNGTGDDGSIEDMDLVNAASVARSGDVFSLVVQNDAGQYVDAKVNDIVVYGIPSGVTPPDLATVYVAP